MLKLIQGLLLLATLFVSPLVYAQNFWESTSGPNVGTAISMTSDSLGNIFVGEVAYDVSPFAGIFVSHDDGETWHKTSLTQESDISMDALAVDADGTVFMGAQLLESTTGQGVIYRTYDGGTTWEQLAFTDAAVYALQPVSVADTIVLMGATGEGVLRSTDKGENWATVAYPDAEVYDIAYGSAGYLYAVGRFSTGYSGVIRSTNGGQTWESPIQLSSYGRVVSTAGVGEVLVGTDSGIYYSDDFSETWIERGLTDQSIKAICVLDDDTWVAGAASAVYRSSDRGQSWIPLALAGEDFEVFNCHETSTGSLFVLTSEGIFKSDDGGNNWTLVGLPRAYAFALTLDEQGKLLAGGFNLFRLGTAANDNWSQLPLQSIFIQSLAASDGYLYAGTLNFGGEYDGLFRSGDNGETWANVGPDSVDVIDLATTTSSVVFIGTVSNGIFRSDDHGEWWQTVGSGLEGTQYQYLAVSEQGIVVTGNNSGVYQLDDDSGEWIAIGPPAEMCGGVCRVDEVMFTPSSVLYAADDTHIYKTVDLGDTWTTTAFPEVNVNALATDDSGNIFAGTSVYGIYQSKNGGETWTNISSGLPTSGSGDGYHSVASLAVGLGGHLFAGTEFYGVYKSVAPITTAIDDPPSVQPRKLMISTAPNPFRGRTTIHFSVPQSGEVTISVFDILGRKIQVLLEKSLASGIYNVEWRASNRPAGVYFVRVTAGEHSQVRKVVHLN